jgi:hypothetical protein
MTKSGSAPAASSSSFAAHVACQPSDAPSARSFAAQRLPSSRRSSLSSWKISCCALFFLRACSMLFGPSAGSNSFLISRSSCLILRSSRLLLLISFLRSACSFRGSTSGGVPRAGRPRAAFAPCAIPKALSNRKASRRRLLFYDPSVPQTRRKATNASADGQIL